MSSTARILAQLFASISSLRTMVVGAIAVSLIFTAMESNACHDSEIVNLVSVDNGNGTTTYTIDIHVEVGSFDGYSYGFALLFQNSTPIQPMVLSNPAFTPQVTRPGYDPLLGFTGANIGSGAISLFSQRYGNSANILTYETTDGWWGFGSTPYDATITVTVSGCIESISLDGDFRSMGTAVGDPACLDTYNTGLTCCQGSLAGTVTETLCPGETFTYQGTVYSENNTSGTHMVSNSQGCDSTVNVNIIIDQNCCDPETSPILGPTQLCQNATGNVYSVGLTLGSTYAWTVPVGATITSGQGTNSITVSFGNGGGLITVIETEPCGIAPQQSLNVVVEPLQILLITNPATVCAPSTVDITAASITTGSSGGGALTYWTNAAGTIPAQNPNSISSSGTYYIQAGSGPCSDIQPVVVSVETPQAMPISGPTPLCENATGNIYSVVNTPGSTYAWTVPQGATIISGQGTNSITVDFGTTGGQVSVIESLSCGNGPQVNFNVDIESAQSLIITDPALVCAPNTIDLTDPTITAGSTGGGSLTYWTDALATVALQNPSAVSGSGTFYIQAGSGSCSDIQPVVVSIETPQTSAISGPASFCQNSSGNTFSVVNTPGSAYSWSVPTGATIASGQGSNTITVDFGLSGGQVTVVETLSCGYGPQLTFDVTLDPIQNLVITDPAPICEPNLVNLTTASVTAGSTGGGLLTYWTDAAATVAITDPTSVSAGTYYIQSGNGSCSDIQAVTATINVCANCSMTGMSFTMTDCYSGGQGLQYDLEGMLTYTEAPTTGTLVVSDCMGNQQIFNPPFNGSQVFNFQGLPQDGLACDFTASFTDDPTCTITVGFDAPPAITNFQSNCVSGSGQVNGSVDFNNSPTSGTIVVEVFDGTNTQSTNILPPFNSPESWAVSGLDPSAGNYVVTYYFSDFPSCGNSQSIICGCSAAGGSTSVNLVGNGSNSYVLCAGDQINITSNNDYELPADLGPLDYNGIQYVYQPAYAYLVYSCEPTPGVFPQNDPCFLGFSGSDFSLTDINDPNSVIGQFPAGSFSGNQVFYVPATMYHYDTSTPAYVFNSNCWALGSVTAVTYLSEIESITTEDCQNGSVAVQVSGGYPEVSGGNFTGSSLLPTTASFSNSSTGNGGSIVIEGLQNGDNYSFEIEDGSGCPITISGGPFIGGTNAQAGMDDQSCDLSYTLQANNGSASGTWSGGPAGTTFTPSVTDPNAIVSVSSAGTFTFTWTEDNGSGCLSTDDVEVTFTSISIPAVITNASCGTNDGEITVAPQGGSGTYDYSWSSGGSSVTESNLGAGPVTITVTDNNGCTLDSTFNITQPTSFNVSVHASDANCFGSCDGEIDLLPDLPGTYDYSWTPNVSSGNSSSSLCPGSYQIEVSDQAGCTETVTANVAEPAKIQVLVSANESDICINGSADLSSQISGGSPQYTYNWTSFPIDINLISSDPTPSVSPQVPTIYSLVVTDASGCESEIQNVTLNVFPELTLEVTQASICPGEEATIDVVAFGGDGNHAVYLLPNTIDPVNIPITVQPSSTSTYEFMVIDGCETPPAQASGSVEVHAIPTINLDAEPKTGCAPLRVDFQDLTTPSPEGWNWDFEGTVISGIQDPSFTYEEAGIFNVGLSITTTEGCSVDTVLENYIEVYHVPEAYFEISDDLVSVLDADVAFTDLSEGQIKAWLWDFGDGEQSTIQNPNHRFQEVGLYEVMLAVESAHGCASEVFQYVDVEPGFAFYVPNAFTPNHDQHNNIFRGVGEGIDLETYQMSILNRWGEVVYHTANIDAGWDGTYKGMQVELGVYAYEISLRDLTGKEHYYRGHVTLTR